MSGRRDLESAQRQVGGSDRLIVLLSNQRTEEQGLSGSIVINPELRVQVDSSNDFPSITKQLHLTL